MLGLKLPTDPRWANLASMTLGEILTDHAYCEQKAASTGISIIQKFPEYETVVDAIVPIVSEEWGHFKLVLDELKKRNLHLGRQRRDEYVNRLIEFSVKTGRREVVLVDKLLFAAMIEARSCERFKLLSKELLDEDLQEFYKRLMVSEAGHYRLFLDLACSVHDKDKVMQRWEEWLEYEAAVIAGLDLRGDRMH